MQHLIDNKLIRESQHGFMPGKSCASNLVTFMEFVTKAVDDGESVNIFYLDFAKAFDKVPRQRLIRKLIAKGVDANIVRWIENWLTGRTQRLCIQEQQSGDCDVDSGVPIGHCPRANSVRCLSVYIDDLEVEVVAENLDVLIVKFADNTKGAKVIRGEEDRQKLQQALDILYEWADKWGMSFNVAKCKIMHVGRE